MKKRKDNEKKKQKERNKKRKGREKERGEKERTNFLKKEREAGLRLLLIDPLFFQLFVTSLLTEGDSSEDSMRFMIY